MNITVWPSKDPRDIVTATFDYSAALEVGETISTALVQAATKQGTDANPALLLNGTAVINGNYVLQSIRNGVTDNSYLITCVATLSTGRVITVAGVVPVKTIS